MDNQHRKIKGYRELDQATLDAMNVMKKLESEVEKALNYNLRYVNADPRLTAIAKTDIMKAFMVCGRAVARPDSYPEKENVEQTSEEEG